MAYQIRFTESADQDLQWYHKRDQQIIIAEVDDQLRYNPTVATARRKRLQPNALAEWELRIGDFRVFYSVIEDAVLVSVVAVGRKTHRQLRIRGKEFKL